MSDLAVGTPLWYVGRGEGTYVPITKVGRKYYTFFLHNREKQCHKDTLAIHEPEGAYGYGPGRLYLSQESHEAELERNRAWAEFRFLMNPRYSPPEHLTLQDIQTMTAMLKPAQ